MKIEKVPGTRAFLVNFTKEGTSASKPNNAQNGVRVEITSPLFKILYQRGGNKISYHLLVICIAIRGTRVSASCDIFFRMTCNAMKSNKAGLHVSSVNRSSPLDLE